MDMTIIAEYATSFQGFESADNISDRLGISVRLDFTIVITILSIVYKLARE